MLNSLQSIADHLYVWVILFLCSVGYLAVNSKGFAQWHAGFSKILENPALNQMDELRKMEADLSRYPQNYIDRWMILAALWFVTSMILTVIALLHRSFVG